MCHYIVVVWNLFLILSGRSRIKMSTGTAQIGITVHSCDIVWLQLCPESQSPRNTLQEPKCGITVYSHDLLWSQLYPEIHYCTQTVESLVTVLILFSYVATRNPLIQPKCGIAAYNPDLIWSHAVLQKIHYYSPSCLKSLSYLATVAPRDPPRRSRLGVIVGWSGTEMSTILAQVWGHCLQSRSCLVTAVPRNPPHTQPLLVEVVPRHPLF